MARVLISWAGLQVTAGETRVLISWSELQVQEQFVGAVTDRGDAESTTFTDAFVGARVTQATISESAGTATDSINGSVASQAQTFSGSVVEPAGSIADHIDASIQQSGLGEFYPSFPQWEGTRLVPRSGIMERIATNGTVRLRALQSTTKYDPVVVHGFLSASERTQLIDFYDHHRTYSFTFTAQEDGVPRTCIFASNPFQIEPVAGMPNLYSATVYLREA